MMAVLIIILGAALAIFGFMMMSDDFMCGFICLVFGAMVAWGGNDYSNKKDELKEAQHQVEVVKAAYKVQLRNLDAKFMEAQEAAMELAIENQSLTAKQDECVVKQQVSQGTLSDIKEILEN